MPATEGALAQSDIAALTGALRTEGFRGGIDHDPASCAAASTDNSVYCIAPSLILSPQDEADCEAMMRCLNRPQFARWPVTARGGGTGTNGQSLNSGIVVDLRRRMNRILEINPEAGWADVEPGVVLDLLNDTLAAHGLFFAPETSTSSRCTIGGMVATDASGKGSRRYGKTADNVIGLSAIIEGRAVNSLAASLPAALEAEVEAACNSGRPHLLSRVPALSRRFSGYDLERARRGPDGFEWWRLFIGAEGTLGLVTRIRLRLLPRPPHRRLLVAAFDGFAAALDSVSALLGHQPLAVECLDEWVARLAGDAGLLLDLPRAVRGADGQAPVFNFIECSGGDAEALNAQVAAIARDLPKLSGFTGLHVASDPEEIARLWTIRSASVGLLARRDDAQRGRVPVSFVEDCVLPPENLSTFVAEFGALMQAEGLRYGIYGHADVGCLHVRPALDIADLNDRVRLGRISDQVFAMVTRLGGIFWGEHGKGVRGQYLAELVGAECFAAFRQIKSAFDPNERFNPGKLITLERGLLGVRSTPFRPMRRDGVLARAYGCNGNALCHSYAASQPMCPSFRVSGQALHSPKGRAEALKLWDGARRSGSLTPLIEASVHAAMETCLGCKACASTCPIQIDIPEMRSHFLEHWHGTRPRRLSDRAMILLERHHRAIGRLRPFLAFGPVAALMSRLAVRLGVNDAPSVSRRGLADLGVEVVTPRQVASRVSRGKLTPNNVLIAPDAFSELFDTDAICDIVDGLRALGFAPAILRLPAGGKAAHASGARAAFLRMATILKGELDRLADCNLPVIACDPSFVTLLREEYRHAGMMPRRKVVSMAEFLLSLPEDALPRLPPDGQRYRVFLHCTERAKGQTSSMEWRALGERLGLNFEIAATGCCGMSGAYGHEARNLTNSRKLFDLSWAPLIEPGATVMATGFSCRCQSRRFAQAKAVHPMRLIADRFAGLPRSDPAKT
ncbi:FAD-binding protein [Paracoccus litorisediminis]|uniref:FAD-binding protein n=2 Tax=Paracoccus litorisediminis TaxID=2006130 RepID=A0A844HS83_9RHOB|nr:FAD-binding protein [Paracoccus litorisediminis]